MSLDEIITQHVHALSESEKVEALNFIEYLKSKNRKERKTHPITEFR